MKNLENLLKKYAKGKNSRLWLGARPEGRESQMGRIIAAQVGYPTAKIDPFVNGGMVRLDRKQAANVLAVAGTTSLAYDTSSPRISFVKGALEALNDLTGDATFLSNGYGLLESNAGSGWSPLTDATFECGVIGYNATHAFVFWVEEED